MISPAPSPLSIFKLPGRSWRVPSGGLHWVTGLVRFPSIEPGPPSIELRFCPGADDPTAAARTSGEIVGRWVGLSSQPHPGFDEAGRAGRAGRARGLSGFSATARRVDVEGDPAYDSRVAPEALPSKKRKTGPLLFVVERCFR